MLKIAKVMYDSQEKYFHPDELAAATGIPAESVKKILEAGMVFKPSLFYRHYQDRDYQVASDLLNLMDAVFKFEMAPEEKLREIEENFMKSNGFALIEGPKKEPLVMFQPRQCIIQDLIYEHPKMQDNGTNVVQFDHQYKIYCVHLGRGNAPIFLITEPYINLPLGFSELLIQHVRGDPFKALDLQWPQAAACNTMSGLRGFKPNEKKHVEWPQCWDTLLSLNEDTLVFATLAKPIKKDDLDIELQAWSNEDFLKLVDAYYQNDGWEVDDNLKYLYRADKILITKGRTPPYELVKYQPHKVVVTNTKVGKTSMAKLNGIVLDRVSGSRFLGFSTAKDINPGLGNGLLEPTYFDEVGSLTQIFVDHILNYLEFGETRVEVGKMGILTKGWSLCTFHSNPEVPTDDPAHMLLGLSSFLQKFSIRLDAIGSRMGLIIFETKWQKAKKSKARQIDVITNKVMLDTILDMIQPKVEKLFHSRPVSDWLEEPCSDYEATIKALLEKNSATILDMIRQLYISHAEGCHRHLRGFAFRQAVLDHMKDIYFDTLDTSAFLESCDEHLQRASALNIRSLLNMCQSGFNIFEEYRFELTRLPSYLRGLVVAFDLWNSKNPGKELVPIEELKDVWEGFCASLEEGKVPKDIEVSQYAYFSRILDRMKRTDLVSMNKRLDRFGIELLVYPGTDVTIIRIKKEDNIFSQISQVLKKGNEKLDNNFSVSQKSSFLNGLYKGITPYNGVMA